MKTAYKWFDAFLNLLLVSVVLEVVAIVALGMNNFNFPLKFFPTIGAVFTIILLITLLFGLLYITIGISLLILNWKLKNSERFSLGKRLLIKGIIRSILAFLFFFLMSLVLSFFGLSEPNCLCLPKILEDGSQEIQQQDTPTFPIEDLTITDRKSYPPQPPDNTWSCDLTIENRNASMSAVNITFDFGHLKDTTDDTITAEGTKVINVYADGNSQNICDTISITGADIVTPDTSPSPSISPSPGQ